MIGIALLPLVAAEDFGAGPVAALKKEFQLVEQQIKQQGKITPGVYSTVQKLSQMISSIIEPNIEEAHAADQLLLNVVFSEISMCDAKYKKFVNGKLKKGQMAMATVKTEFDHCGGTVEQLKEKYEKCLNERDVLVRHNNTVCCQEFAMCSSATGYGDCEHVKLQEGFVGCDYKSHSGQECFAAVKGMVAPLEGYFKGQDAKYEAIRHECQKFTAATKAKVAECSYLQEAVNAKVKETNEMGREVNEAGEALTRDSHDECAEYQQCRQTTEAAYVKLVGPCATGAYDAGGDCVKNREADRHNEWQATQLIKCMLDHYCQGGEFKDELLEQCKASISSYHLSLIYHKVPELLPCEIPTCPTCPGCDECVDRPYYQYETPCYGQPLGDAPVCVEQGECPEWCDAGAEAPVQPAPVPQPQPSQAAERAMPEPLEPEERTVHAVATKVTRETTAAPRVEARVLQPKAALAPQHFHRVKEPVVLR